MKETVNVNIGSMPFTLDTDAYAALRTYFNDVRSRLPEDDLETAADIETRMGEILREKAPSLMYVISIEMVQAAIQRLGTPDCFGDPHTPNYKFENNTGIKRLYRSRTNRAIAGVCGGIGEYFNLDPTIIRLITILLCFTTVAFWVYIILWILVPEEERPFQPNYHK